MHRCRQRSAFQGECRVPRKAEGGQGWRDGQWAPKKFGNPSAHTGGLHGEAKVIPKQTCLCTCAPRRWGKGERLASVHSTCENGRHGHSPSSCWVLVEITAALCPTRKLGMRENPQTSYKPKTRPRPMCRPLCTWEIFSNQDKQKEFK